MVEVKTARAHDDGVVEQPNDWDHVGYEINGRQGVAAAEGEQLVMM